MKSYKYVIVGGGTAAGYAAKEFADQKIGPGELCIVSSESTLPINRPPLSKEYLKDDDKDDDILINESDFYDEHGIEVLTDTWAKRVRFAEKIIELENEEDLMYEKLLITTGSKLKKADITNQELENIFYLRDKNQSDSIREKALNAKTAVVVGGGYIGTETAGILSSHGLKVTVVVPEDKLMAKFVSDDIGAFFDRKFRDNGINVLYNQSVDRFEGKDKVEEVVLSSGERIAADMVVIGAGVEPNVDIFKDTHLTINQGVVVNRYCQTNIQDVYAAGDVTEFPDMIFDKIRHFEHWENAFEQGRHAVRVMMGHYEPYVFIPYFFSDILDVSFEYYGDNSTASDVKNRGNMESGDFSTWWFEGDKLVAAFIMSTRPRKEGETAKEMIRNRMKIEKDKIENPEKELQELILNA